MRLLGDKNAIIVAVLAVLTVILVGLLLYFTIFTSK